MGLVIGGDRRLAEEEDEVVPALKNKQNYLGRNVRNKGAVGSEETQRLLQRMPKWWWQKQNKTGIKMWRTTGGWGREG